MVVLTLGPVGISKYLEHNANSLSPVLSPEKQIRDLKLELEWTEAGIVVRTPWPTSKLYRSYSPIQLLPSQNLSIFELTEPTFLDKNVPDGMHLYYLALNAEEQWIAAEIETQPRDLPSLAGPTILVDKSHYVLEIWDGDTYAKKYAIALGKAPKHRKYCVDYSSTPEGWYEITNLQPRATYYRAYDIDYPRPVDFVRRDLHAELGFIEPSRSIGGEIQIHGRGISWNWTAGCVALRDQDMDELFAEGALDVGVPVFLFGSEIQREDQDWLKNPPIDAVKFLQERLHSAGFYEGALDGTFGDQTALALGRYQHAHSLPLSCQLDRVTREHFELR